MEQQTGSTTTTAGRTPAACGSAVLSVLVIEDNPLDARLIEETLSEAESARFRWHWVQSFKAGCEALAAAHYDLVLLDLSLPDSFGVETFERVHRQFPEVPVIVMSGLADESVALRALQGGAQDYLVKGHGDTGLLVRAIRYALERKRIERALEEERELFSTIMENLPDHIYFKDRDSRFVRVSRSLAAKFGFKDPAEMLDKTDFDVFTEDHARPAFEDEQQLMRTGQPLVGKIERETMPDGSVSWALTTKMPRRDKYGRVVGTFGVSKDITELKLIEDVLAAERNMLRSLIDALPDHIYVKDADSRFILCNQAVANFFGLPRPEQIVGTWDFDYFPRDQARRFYDEEQELMRSVEQRLNRESAVLNGAGRQHWLMTTKVVMRDGNRRATGLVGINRDVTEMKEAERRLNQLNSDLARSQLELLGTYENLKKSNEELQATQLRLIQSAKMESIGRLAAGVAHEVKNPLAILVMGVEYLGDTLKDGGEDVLMTLAQMTEAVKRADGIVHGLLDFAASSELHLADASLNGAVEQSLVLVRHALRERRIRVVRNLAADLPGLKLDRLKIEQVLINLFMNAAQAMTKGGDLIVTTRRTVAEDGRAQVVMQVEDTGPGIPPELLAKVFDPFYTTKPSGAGTGLGLGVARNIIALHNGTLELVNRDAGGVRVTVTFNM